MTNVAIWLSYAALVRTNGCTRWYNYRLRWFLLLIKLIIIIMIEFRVHAYVTCNNLDCNQSILHPLDLSPWRVSGKLWEHRLYAAVWMDTQPPNQELQFDLRYLLMRCFANSGCLTRTRLNIANFVLDLAWTRQNIHRRLRIQLHGVSWSHGAMAPDHVRADVSAGRQCLLLFVWVQTDH